MRCNIMHILVSPSKNRSKSVDAGHSTDKEKSDVINKTFDNNEKNSDNDYLVCTRKNLKSNHDVNMEKQIVKTGDNSTIIQYRKKTNSEKQHPRFVNFVI